MSKIKFIQPKTNQQLIHFKRMVTAKKGSHEFNEQIKNWNRYVRKYYWYLRSPKSHKAHIKSSTRWEQDVKNRFKTKYYRLHSYFKNFTTKKAFVPDLEDEKRWLEERRTALAGDQYQSPKFSAKRLPRGSSKTFTYTSNPRSSRLHRSYRSYAHHYITLISSKQDWKRAMALVEKSFKKQVPQSK